MADRHQLRVAFLLLRFQIRELRLLFCELRFLFCQLPLHGGVLGLKVLRALVLLGFSVSRPFRNAPNHSNLSQDRHGVLRFTTADRKGTKGSGCSSEDSTT